MCILVAFGGKSDEDEKAKVEGFLIISQFSLLLSCSYSTVHIPEIQHLLECTVAIVNFYY